MSSRSADPPKRSDGFDGKAPSRFDKSSALVSRSSQITFIRYVVQGASLNLLGLGLFSVLVLIFPEGQPAFLSIGMSILLFPFSFAVNRIWVFRSDSPIGGQALRFLAVYSSAAIGNAVLLEVLVAVLPFPLIVVQALALGSIVFLSFLANYLWAFAKRERGS